MKFLASLTLFFIFLTACAGPTVAPVQPTPSTKAANTPTPAPIARATNTPAPTNTPPPTDTPAPLTTKLILWENLAPAQADQLSLDIKAFKQFYPNARIEIQHYDNPQELAAAIIEGRVDYDIVLGAMPLLSPLQQADKLQPLSQLFPPDFLNAFASVTLTGASAEDDLWGLPDSAGFHLLLFYNRDLLETPPSTTEEMRDLAADLSGGAQWGLVLNSFDPLWVLPWLSGFDGWIIDDEGAPTLNTEAMAQTLTLYKSWHQMPGGIAPQVSLLKARELFNEGKAAMLIDGEWAIGELAQESQIPWSVAVLPAVGEDERPAAPLVLARCWALSADTSGRQAEAAIAFLEFITRAERQLVWTEKFGLLPTRRDALNSPQILTDPALRVSAQQLQNGKGLPLDVDAVSLLNAMRQPLDLMLRGKVEPTEAAAQMTNDE